MTQLQKWPEDSVCGFPFCGCGQGPLCCYLWKYLIITFHVNSSPDIRVHSFDEDFYTLWVSELSKSNSGFIPEVSKVLLSKPKASALWFSFMLDHDGYDPEFPATKAFIIVNCGSCSSLRVWGQKHQRKLFSWVTHCVGNTCSQALLQITSQTVCECVLELGRSFRVNEVLKLHLRPSNLAVHTGQVVACSRLGFARSFCV